ncbi:class I SAM-dependent methyltransferase [Prochlorococcus marinus]|uniref:SAM-dependent methyltransferase n=1 Tax=Prochlorococcus marinus (strain AS9601) TaxID=146891 RepID=A2BSC8_PROMS|nr:class I SAM-dependent methyltransferase [Prochlorococcus marinus]ABM70689.1 Hypothetical protein A9601_14051 [Prochlorococcus marinus str. AS9601]
MNLKCRHCGKTLNHEVIDLGNQPPSNAYLDKNQILRPEITYPLKVYACEHCWLIQLPEHATSEELFTPDYAYFSSTSTSWCAHAEKFVNEAVSDHNLSQKSFVVELASNDGYLLQYLKSRGIPCLGVEPTRAAAEIARSKGINTIESFFGLEMAKDMDKADLVIANNVLAHVPDINDFMGGIHEVLKPKGKASIEFPHLLRMIKGKQFDTIYHEHFSYLSLRTVQRIASSVGLEIFKVSELSTHGGSLRVWLSKKNNFEIDSSVERILNLEVQEELESLKIFEEFRASALKAKYQFLDFLIKAKNKNKKIMAYGAAAKGNTFLNFAGIKSDLISLVADKSISKQNKFMPGSLIPIVSPKTLLNEKPDSIIVLPWNIISEIRSQLKNHQLVTAIPNLKVWNNL